ncbi:MAG: tRNA (adenosine(37)-N6)-threonylcarbamoyltransferase complex ATPase subunit type 1 TsaE [bacterium]|nr:tRNA (adenosine(37)-N6)-threonylcarbamoyltransferase complex ATPase subunit type 1 TsaE [bacterium]
MKKILEVFTKSEGETQKFAKLFASEILSARGSAAFGGKAIVVGLEGELGAGKTTFVKGFAGGLGIKETMTSPSFILMRVFKIKNRKFFHIDAWRDRLDFREFLKNPRNILLIEWCDKVKHFLPKNYFRFHLKVLSPNLREITLWR